MTTSDLFEPRQTAEPVGFVGLGLMGLPMALNLAQSGFTVYAWNRSDRPRAALAGTGVRLRADPTEVARAARVVVTMLPDLAEVRQVLGGTDGSAGMLSAMRADDVLVVMGTVSPTAVRSLGAELAARGVRLVDAPVSGGDVAARDATLSIMVGGDDDAVRQVRPLLQAMGTTVRHLGPLGAGQLTKACNQIVVGVTLAALAEAVTLGRRSRLDVSAMLDVLAAGLAGSRLLDVKRENWVLDTYEPGGRAAFQLKDLRIALAAAADAGVRLPVTAAVEALFAELVDSGHGDDDHSAVIRVIERPVDAAD